MNLFVLLLLHISLILGDYEKQSTVKRARQEAKTKHVLRLHCHYKLSGASVPMFSHSMALPGF